MPCWIKRPIRRKYCRCHQRLNVSTNTDGGYCAFEWPYVSFYAGTENGLPPDPGSGTFHTPGPYTFDAVGFSENWQELPDACTWFSYYVVNVDAPVGTDVTVNFTDGAGCPGTFNFTTRPPIVFPSMQVVNVTGSCTDEQVQSVRPSFQSHPRSSSSPSTCGTRPEPMCRTTATTIGRAWATTSTR